MFQLAYHQLPRERLLLITELSLSMEDGSTSMTEEPIVVDGKMERLMDTEFVQDPKDKENILVLGILDSKSQGSTHGPGKLCYHLHNSGRSAPFRVS